MHYTLSGIGIGRAQPTSLARRGVMYAMCAEIASYWCHYQQLYAHHTLLQSAMTAHVQWHLNETKKKIQNKK